MSFSMQIPILIFLPPFFAAITMPFFSKNKSWLRGIALMAVGLSIAASIYGITAVVRSGPIDYYMGGWIPPYGIQWRLDFLSACMALLISSIAWIVLFAAGPAVEKRISRSLMPYYVITMLHVMSLLGIVLTHDLFNLFVFLEVSSLTAYALIASGDQYRGNVASLKYLMIGTMGASFYLLGVGYLYAATGTLNMTDVAEKLPALIQSRSVLTGIILIAIGIFIKMGLFPFHGWLPDAYTYASDPATALIAPLMTKTAIYMFMRIFYHVLDASFLKTFALDHVLLVFGSTALIMGSLYAFFQTDFKKMLAFSSISQIGLIVLALGLQNSTAYTGAFMHMIHHALMKASLFTIAASAAYTHGIRDIFSFDGLKYRMPYTLAAFVIAALSMTGAPPLCGFFSKWYIVAGAIEEGAYGFAGLIIASSLLTALYFFKVIERAFFQKSEPKPLAEAPWTFGWGQATLSIAIIGMGLIGPKIYGWGMLYLLPKGLP